MPDKAKPTIKSIQLDAAFAQYRMIGNDSLFGPLGKLNILVGENNSGKSRFLRALLKAQLVFESNDESINELNAVIQDLKTRLTQVLGGGTRDANGYFHHGSNLGEVQAIREQEKYAEPVLTLARKLTEASANQCPNATPGWSHQTARNVKDLGNETLQKLENLRLAESFTFNRIYIPILRGLRDVADGQDVYQQRTLKDYFADAKQNPVAFTGLSLHSAYKSMLLGTAQQRRWVREFEQFLGTEFFNGRELTIIPRDENRALEVQIAGHNQRSIAHLGDGIHSIILLAFPLFQHRNERMLFFFEEPEIHLHPALQRLFLNLLTSVRFPNHQYFLTTHSNHFLDITADLQSVSIFTFRRERQEESENESENRFLVENVSNDDERTLALLGVRNSSVFLSNCTIWVEGITDRRYLSHWLALLTRAENKTSFREDLHFSFVEYSGSNITHWSFLDAINDPIEVKRLCGKVFLIADGDESKANSKKSERHKALQEGLKDRFALLPCREIENLLTPTVLMEVVKAFEGEGVSFQQIQQKDYRTEYLGTFVENRLISSNWNRQHRYAAKGDRPSIIANKVDFCAEALKHTKSFNDLSVEAKELTRKIYTFVEENNR